jgi:hypothetical protein
MSSHEAPAQVADFFNTIEEAGIADIAAEVGIIPDSGTAISPPRASSLPPLDESVQPSYLTSHGGGSSSNGAGSSIMPGPGAIVEGGTSYVHMSYSGPQVPEGLASTLIAAGEPAAKKKRMQRTHGGKAGDKGLRHFSMKVCEKVEQKGKTTYNEVADELVAEFAVDTSEGASALDQQYDEKNIRRRVYDALNVLMAMDIITKEKKNIMWRGLPTNTEQEGARLKMDLASRKERLEKKRFHLQELLTQQISFKNLVQRNGAPKAEPGDRIPLPFIIVNTHKETVIDCEMAEDKQEIFFNFSAPFEIHDDNEIMKRMQLHRCHSQPELEQLVPPHLAPFAASWQQHWTAKELPKPEPEPAPEPAMLLPVPQPTSGVLGLIP